MAYIPMNICEANNSGSGVLKVGPGVHYIDSPLTLSRPVVVDPGAVINVSAPITRVNGGSWSGVCSQHQINKTGSFNLFTITGDGARIGGFQTDESKSDWGYTIMFDATQPIQNTRIKEIKTFHSNGLVADNSGGGSIIDMHMDDVMARLHRGRASYLTKAFAYIFIERCTADYIGNTSNCDLPAWTFIGAQGLHVNNVDVTGTAITGNKTNQHGFWFQGCEAVILGHTMADNVGGRGHAFVGCHDVEAQNLKSSMVGGFGLTVEGSTTDLRIDKALLSGRNGLESNTTQALIWTSGNNSNLTGSDLLTERCTTIDSGYSSSEFSWLHKFSR